MKRETHDTIYTWVVILTILGMMFGIAALACWSELNRRSAPEVGSECCHEFGAWEYPQSEYDTWNGLSVHQIRHCKQCGYSQIHRIKIK